MGGSDTIKLLPRSFQFQFAIFGRPVAYEEYQVLTSSFCMMWFWFFVWMGFV